MIISDRDQFIGAHLTLELKEKLRVEAQRRKMSMSALIAEIVEKWLAAPPENDRRRSNRRFAPLTAAEVAEEAAVEAALKKEADIPLPLDS